MGTSRWGNLRCSCLGHQAPRFAFRQESISREQRATPATDLWLVTDTRRHRLNTREAGAAAGSGRTRLIAVEGVLSITRSPGYHCVDCLRWQTAWLVALAFASKRTLVLPPVMFDFGYQMLAVYVDIASISQLIECRETNFLSDPRLHRHLYLEQQQQQQHNHRRHRRQRQQHKDVSTGFTSSVRLPGNWSSSTSPFPFSSVARLSVMPSKSKQWKISVSTTAAIGTTGTERGGSNSTQHSCRSRVVPGALLQEKFLRWSPMLVAMQTGLRLSRYHSHSARSHAHLHAYDRHITNANNARGEKNAEGGQSRTDSARSAGV